MSVDTYTKLLLHCNGADTSTTFTDSSGNNYTVTAVGNAQIDTAQYKFGGASGLFDGTGDYLTVPDNADWDFGSGNFTVDWWEYRTNKVTTQLSSMSRDDEVISAFLIGYSNGANWRVYMSSDNTNWDIAEAKDLGEIDINTQTHLAVVRSANTFYTFKNGTQISTWGSTGTLAASAKVLEIGRGQGAYCIPGWMDEIRISKGIARWTANFTPPTSEYGGGFLSTKPKFW